MGKFFKEREEGVYLYAHWLANYPWLVILVVLSVSALLIGLAFRTPFVLDSGGAGFVPRSDPVGIRKDSLLAAIDYSYFSSQISAGMPPTVIQVQQSVPGPTIAFIYEKNARATSPNVLSDAAIDEMRAFEVAFAARPNFTDYCLKIGGVCAQPFSLQNFFWPPNGRGTVKSSNTSSEVLSRIPAAQLAQLVDKNFRNPGNFLSNFSQALFTFGYPLAGFNNSRNDQAAQDARYNRWIISQRTFFNAWNRNSTFVDVLWLGQGVTQADTDSLLLGDAAWAGAAILFVVIWMIFHTVSFWLALWAMFQIILSFPVSYFFIVVPLGVKSFNTLNMLGIFILVGIGADDAFIFTDRWKQSEFQEGCITHATRMAWTFKSAAKSMFITSITTAVSFFINASSTIVPIRIFGIFVGLLVMINYIFVVTLYPSFVSIWGLYFENKCLDRKIKNATGRPIHPLTNNAPKSEEPYSKASSELADRAMIKKMRRIERFFYFKYFRFIMFWRIPIICLFVGLIIGMIIMCTRLAPADAPAAFLPDQLPLQRALSARSNAFNSTPSPSTVHLYWGVTGVDASGVDPNDVNQIGRPVYDPLFDMSSPAAQSYVLQVCAEARNEPSTRNREVLCPMEDFRQFLEDQARPFPSPTFAQDLRDFVDFYAVNKSVVAQARGNPGFGVGPPLGKSFQNSVRFDNVTNTFRVMQIIVNVSIPTALAAVGLRPYYSQWDAFVSRMALLAPSGVRGLTHISDRWLTISTEDALFSSAVFGLWTSLVIAYGVLIILTLNIWTSTICMISIGSVVACVIGTMVSIGWTLGVIESICLTIVTGLSVDYSAHIGETYDESHKGARLNRLRDMLGTIGLSVFSAGVTSFGSACFLLGTTIIFFFRFGVFIMLTIGYSFIFALLFLPCVLSFIGASGNFGKLTWFVRNKPKFLADLVDWQDEYPDLIEFNKTHDFFGRPKNLTGDNKMQVFDPKDTVEL